MNRNQLTVMTRLQTPSASRVRRSSSASRTVDIRWRSQTSAATKSRDHTIRWAMISSGLAGSSSGQ
jgi:hypothetical protein